MSEEVTSLRARAAAFTAMIANNLHAAKDPVRRSKLYNHEPEWKCPAYHLLSNVDLGECSADLLRLKKGSGILPGDGTGHLEEMLKVLKETVRPRHSENAAVLQLHGGGYYLPMHNLYRDTAVIYSMLFGGADVLTPDYRTAPDDPFPAAFEDALDAYKWLLKDHEPENIIFAGDSAGGGLALALAAFLRDKHMPLPSKMITMSAWTDLTKSGVSYKENFNNDPVFGGSKDTLVFKDGYYRDDDPENPCISPIFADKKGLPPILMQVGDREMLLSDTVDFAEEAKKEGVDVRTHVYPGMFHIFQMGLYLFPEAVSAWEEVGRFINEQKEPQVS